MFIATRARANSSPRNSLCSPPSAAGGDAVENAPRLYEQAEQSAVFAERSRLARECMTRLRNRSTALTLYAEAAARLLSAGQHVEASGHCAICETRAGGTARDAAPHL